MEILIIFILLILLLLIGLPVIITLGGVGALWILISGNNPTAIPSSFFEGINSFVQLAVPFFILCGELMSRTQMTDKLIDFSRILVGRVRSGLAYTNVLTSMFFSGLTGAGVSDVSALGTVFIPAMEKQGYRRSFAAMLVAVSAIIGPTIPPSIIAVIYGAVTNVSIGGMLLATTIPGILIGILQMVTIRVFRKRYKLPDDRQTVKVKEYPKIIRGAALAILMPIIILGGILFGVFTPTEAAAVAVFYALFIGVVIYRTLSFSDIYESIVSTVRTSANMYLLMAAGAILTWMMARSGIPGQIAETLISLTDNPIIIFFIAMAITLFLGLFMDNAVALVLVAPILAPIASQVGIPDLQFGAAMIVALNIGLITPPFGMCFFAASAVGKVKFEAIVKEAWPFLLCSLIALILVMLIPQLTLFLPTLGGFQ